MLLLLLTALAQEATGSKATSSPPTCAVGTQLRLRETTDAHLAAQRQTSDQGLTYRTTRTIESVDARCVVMIIAYDPNSSGARLSDGSYVWLRDWSQPAAIVSTPIFETDSYPARPTWTLDAARECDKSSTASTTFGPLSSCLSLHQERGSGRLHIKRHSSAHNRHLSTISLPAGVRYQALSAGSWAHNIGGEIALIRSTEGRTAVVDIFTLSGS